jgi:hypothetical protein
MIHDLVRCKSKPRLTLRDFDLVFVVSAVLFFGLLLGVLL